MQPNPPSHRTITIAAAIIWRAGHILLVQRPAEAELGGLWEFPGGKLEPGETAPAALVRELREELDIAVAVGDLYHTTTYLHPDGLQVRLYFYTCDWPVGALRLLWGQAYRWVAPADLPSYPVPAADAEVVTRLADLTPPPPSLRR
ncbi:MAG: (deoxy)nucleoside triphosphate pyrophosphohydrolase, partial [Chloroflexota bacterium]|nr:(deoxy)nucleoside triphosphate pyrophosphohydrolase [Chloroflexota bacterium]